MPTRCFLLDNSTQITTAAAITRRRATVAMTVTPITVADEASFDSGGITNRHV